jgi:hypothetical protein
VLEVAISHYTKAGIAVTVYLNPMNVEQLSALGVWDEDGIQATVSQLRATIESAGGHFVDLHGLLPDAGFRDPAGHLAFRGELDGPVIVGRALAEAIAQDEPRWQSTSH